VHHLLAGEGLKMSATIMFRIKVVLPTPDFPKHDEHEEMLDWLDDIVHLEPFSIDAVNHRLQQQFRLTRKASPYGQCPN
jgi:hypothetical protein